MEITSIIRLGIFGSAGSGKSNTAYVLLENLRKRGQPCAIIDLYDEYRGLTGTEAVQAATISPGQLAVDLRTSNASAVISLSGVDKYIWVRDFIMSCLKLKRTVPILIVLDEAHNFAPQRGAGSKSRAAINALLSEGRKMGYGALLISQRIAKVDKDSVTQLDTIIIHRHAFQTDLKFLEDIVGKERIDQVRGLRTGSAIVEDMKNNTFTNQVFPKAENKTIGETPVPTGTTSIPLSQVDHGGYSPRASGSSSPGSPMVWAWLVVIIIFVIIIAGSYYLYRVGERVGHFDQAPGGHIWSEVENVPE